MAYEIRSTQGSQSSISSSKGNILLLPYLANGHFNPFIALATLLEKKTSSTITIITTPLNVPTIRSSLPPDSTVALASLPFYPSDYGIPPGTENSHLLPRHLGVPLLLATQTLQPSFDGLVSDICARDGRLPLCIISDQLMFWSVDSARKHGAFHCFFRTFGAYPTQDITSIFSASHQSEPSTDYRTSGNDSLSEFGKKMVLFSDQSDGVMYNTVEEIERKTLDHFRRAMKRVWAVGPMVLARESERRCSLLFTEWLNTQRRSSVLYISFGSENSISPPQMMELAKGLEECRTPFVWVVRPPVGCDDDCLPAGFEERMTERKQGMFFKRWAPQVEILAHESTGAFLSHCGWNSTLESLSHGVPVIGWPINADQFLNSKMLEEELGVGVEIAWGSDAKISGSDIARVVGMVMDGESQKGKEMRRRSREIKEAMKAALVDEESCKGSSIRAIEDFLQTALSQPQANE